LYAFASFLGATTYIGLGRAAGPVDTQQHGDASGMEMEQHRRGMLVLSALVVVSAILAYI
jgi:hypothetical protein